MIVWLHAPVDTGDLRETNIVIPGIQQQWLMCNKKQREG